MMLATLLRTSSESVILIFHFLCLAISTVLVFRLSRFLWNHFISVIISLLWLTYPLLLWLSRQPASEIPFILVFYFGLFLFLVAMKKNDKSLWRFVLIGLLFGVCMLIRPIAIGIPIVITCVFLLMEKRKQWRMRVVQSIVLVVTAYGTLLPWQAWWYFQTGEYMFLSNLGIKGMRDGLTYAVQKEIYRQKFVISEDVRAVMRNVSENQSALVSTSRVGEFMLNELTRDPVAVLKLIGIKVLRSWYATDSGRYETPIMLLQAGYFVAILIGSIRLFGYSTLPSVQRKVGIYIIAIVAYYWLMTISVLSIVRYMTPVIGLLFIFLPGIWQKMIKKK